MQLKLLAVLSVAAALAACKPAPANDQASRRMSDDSVRTLIDLRNADFSHHMMAGHGDSLVTFYAADASVMPPNMPAMHGTEAIRAGLNGMLAQGLPTAFSLRSENVVVSGDMAVERGRWTWTMPGPNNAVVSDSGKYLVHWHKQGATWVMMEDMWNSDAPMAPPAAPARRRS